MQMRLPRANSSGRQMIVRRIMARRRVHCGDRRPDARQSGSSARADGRAASGETRPRVAFNKSNRRPKATPCESN